MKRIYAFIAIVFVIGLSSCQQSITSNNGIFEKKQNGLEESLLGEWAIETTEDREKFRLKMEEIGVNVCKGETATSFLKGKEIAQEIGFPLVIRPSYTLGGYGGGFVNNAEEFDAALTHGLNASPIHEVLVEQSILGWKEYELELLRDNVGNVIIICSIENFDPMGVHTGDSITVAPAQTLPDTTYQAMRDLAIRMMNAIGQFAGGCNVQFAVNPEDDTIVGIEINPRVSRSSALASKATGYPIAKIAAKLAIGYNLDELKNQITKTTSAFFEPALDYVIVKIPRWNFDKFKGSDRRLGLQMKSVGEAMGIGRNFQEALQKACQSLEIKRNGLGADGLFEASLQTDQFGTLQVTDFTIVGMAFSGSIDVMGTIAELSGNFDGDAMSGSVLLGADSYPMQGSRKAQ